MVPFTRTTTPILHLKEDFVLVENIGFLNLWYLTPEGKDLVAILKSLSGSAEDFNNLLLNCIKALAHLDVEYLIQHTNVPVTFNGDSFFFDTNTVNSAGRYFLKHLEKFYEINCRTIDSDHVLRFLEEGIIYEIKKLRGIIFYEYDRISPWFKVVKPVLKALIPKTFELTCNDKLFLSDKPLRAIVDPSVDKLDNEQENYLMTVVRKSQDYARIQSGNSGNLVLIKHFLSRLVAKFVELTPLAELKGSELRRVRFTRESMSYLKGVKGNPFIHNSKYDCPIGPLIIRYPTVDFAFDMRIVMSAGQSATIQNANELWHLPSDINVYKNQLRRVIDLGVIKYGQDLGLIKRVDHQPCFLPTEVDENTTKIKNICSYTTISSEFSDDLDRRHFICDFRRICPFIAPEYRSIVSDIQIMIKIVNDPIAFCKIFMTFLQKFYGFSSIASSFSAFNRLEQNLIKNIFVGVFKMPPTSEKPSLVFKTFLTFDVAQYEYTVYQKEIDNLENAFARLIREIKMEDAAPIFVFLLRNCLEQLLKFNGTRGFETYVDSDIENSFSLSYVKGRYLFERCMESRITNIQKKVDVMLDDCAEMDQFVSMGKKMTGNDLVTALFCLCDNLFQRTKGNKK